MKQLEAAVLALVLILATLGAFPAAQGQEERVDLEQLLTDFSRQISDPGMSVSMMVVHLNDVTTDALFTPPVKYSLRAQARQRTLFYVRGTANRSHWVDMEFASWQGTRNFRVQTTNISNFEPDTQLSAGENYEGIVALEAAVNLRQPFTLQNGDLLFEFQLSPNALARIGGNQ
jgi:hypothetical protein